MSILSNEKSGLSVASKQWYLCIFQATSAIYEYFCSILAISFPDLNHRSWVQMFFVMPGSIFSNRPINSSYTRACICAPSLLRT